MDSLGQGKRVAPVKMVGAVAAGLMVAALSLTGCGPAMQPAPILPTEQYPAWAQSLALVEYCYTTGRTSAEDTVNLRQTTRANLAKYQFDGAVMDSMVQQFLASGPKAESIAARKQYIEQSCAAFQRTAATNKVTDAQTRSAQLQYAQLATARAQAEAAQATSWQPQPYAMPQIPTFQAPLVQTPQFGGNGGATFYHCNQLGSYVISCR